MKNIKEKIYIAVMLIVLLVPFAGMPFAPENQISEFVSLADAPRIREDGAWNVNFKKDAGDYFEDHFAFRSHVLTVNSLIMGRVFGTSMTEGVIYGSNGWLYLSDTLDDYIGENLLTERELYAVVHNLRLMQEYVEQQGSRFVLITVPNKNSIYPENMPYFYRRGETNNLSQLTPLLDEWEISYVDLLTPFREMEERIYFKRDSHWNNKGAAFGNRLIMEFIGREHETFAEVPYQTVVNHAGDLDKMVFPVGYTKEENQYFEHDFCDIIHRGTCFCFWHVVL